MEAPISTVPPLAQPVLQAIPVAWTPDSKILYVGIGTGIEGAPKNTDTNQKGLLLHVFLLGRNEGMFSKKFFESMQSLIHCAQKPSKNVPILLVLRESSQNGLTSPKIKRFTPNNNPDPPK